MPEHSIPGDFAEGDFRDQFGLDPVRTLSFGARDFDSGLGGLERFHPLHQVVDELGVEPRSDLACVTQLASLTNAEEERTEAAALVALRPADNHEFLALDAFDLQPVA